MNQKNTYLGMELGSTRIKAVLIGEDFAPIASGAHDWESHQEGGYWTYSLEEIWAGLRESYQNLAADYKAKFGEDLTSVGAIGISAMMHGYMAFDRAGELLTPFRTWRNTTTGEAAEKLTELFGFNIPQRWSVAHLYQAMLNGEEHVSQIDYLTTLAGYLHWQLTGEKVLGVGDASGMFPIDSGNLDYDCAMLAKFEKLSAGKPWRLRDILPKVLAAGKDGGRLTQEGAKLLDVSGKLQPGIPFCPPEGDAGTGMTATNAVAQRTGNVSAGTSIFAMAVLEKPLGGCYPEIDMVTTPAGKPVAMVHCNNCTSDLDAWVGLFRQFAGAIGAELSKPAAYDILYELALSGQPDCGGLVNFNYFAGEPVTGLDEGRPLFLRRPGGMSLENFMRAQISSAMAALKIGMDILFENEHVGLDKLMGHGGLFKTPVVGQRLMAGAMNVPVTVMETAGEGGPYGMALLAAYLVAKAEGESLEGFLESRVFAQSKSSCIAPDASDAAGFRAYTERYKACLPVERAAAEALKL
ncbi:MAG: FGGY-family carbohydrate kinase [Acutalibacter sp.]|jgi:sugar (pentulose or hexulose) kinase|nr:FGGY-family carbohydrate kinase [Acutalibacter sp.]